MVDYENVQNIDLNNLQNTDVLIMIFHGENQKFTGDFMNSVLALGKEKVVMVKISGNGKNALDFHIAYYIGKLVKEFHKPSINIISKDNGFNPLIKHLNQVEKVICSLRKSISEIENNQNPALVNGKEKHEIVMEILSKPKVPKPKKINTLKNQIATIFKKEKIQESDVEQIVQKMIECKFINCNNEAITYK